VFLGNSVFASHVAACEQRAPGESAVPPDADGMWHRGPRAVCANVDQHTDLNRKGR
jgi:hypothetical protein